MESVEGNFFRRLMATLGGRMMAWMLYQRSDKLYVSVVVLLPFAVAPIEAQWNAPPKLVSIADRIQIDAPPADIWPEIVSVRAISREEVPFAQAHFRTFFFPSVGRPLASAPECRRNTK